MLVILIIAFSIPAILQDVDLSLVISISPHFRVVISNTLSLSVVRLTMIFLSVKLHEKKILKMRFARSLRMNFQQIGDAKAVNRAISQELEATSRYLKKSWSSKEDYYQRKYSGWKRLPQFFKWLEFRALDVVWGNGESIWKLLRALFAVHVLIAFNDTYQYGHPLDLSSYVSSFYNSPAVFFGVLTPVNYPLWYSSGIVATRLVGLAFLTAILVKRFGRR